MAQQEVFGQSTARRTHKRNGTQLRALIVGLERLGNSSKPCFWSAVAQMHGASLHRSYRFRVSRGVRELSGWRGITGFCVRVIRDMRFIDRPAKAVASLRYATALHIGG